jgi:hypothetical protein
MMLRLLSGGRMGLIGTDEGQTNRGMYVRYERPFCMKSDKLAGNLRK